MTKTDDILQEIWESNSKGFEKVRGAVSDLLTDMVEDALARGIVVSISTATYIDWLRTHMREESFMS